MLPPGDADRARAACGCAAFAALQAGASAAERRLTSCPVIVLGLSRELHDPAAALLVDGRCVAAAEEERFTRVKHAPGTLPARAAAFCLAQAGVRGADVDAVVWAWSEAAWRRNRWTHAWRTRHRPRHAWRTLWRRSRSDRARRALARALAPLGVDLRRRPLIDVAHHVAHAASAWRVSGFPRAAVLTLDAAGEYDCTVAFEAADGRLRRLTEWHWPHSLGYLYRTATDYLGFRPDDGEYKVMGMAACGDPARASLEGIVEVANGGYRVSPEHVQVPRAAGWRGRSFSPLWVERFGPPREGTGLSEPHVHVAAAVQRALEDAAVAIVRGPLAPALAAADGALCLAGGCALNVVMNRRLRALPGVRALFVQPAAHDAGGALGAAAEVAARAGDRIASWSDGDAARLGPDVTTDDVRAALRRRGLTAPEPSDLIEQVADLLAAGEVVGWVQGRMEWGPRALGGRSLLAHPGHPGAREALDRAVKSREPWRPYCPAVLAERAGDLLEDACPAPFLTMSFVVRPEWRERLRHAIHVDGTARAQTVTVAADPRFHALIAAFERRTGIPALLNTSLNRAGEPLAATADDALEIFWHTGLRAMAIGPALLRKPRSSRELRVES